MNKMKLKLSSVLEDCLEAIYIITAVDKMPAARVTDISRLMSVNKCNVTSNMKILGELGMVNYSQYRWITLTVKGKRIAKTIYSRHVELVKFFSEILGLPDEVSERNACKMEHLMDTFSMQRLNIFVKFIRNNISMRYNQGIKNFVKV